MFSDGMFADGENQHQSMTGFSQLSETRELVNGRVVDVTIRLKSVNSRHRDLTFRIPDPYVVLESYFREQLSRFFFRGKIELQIIKHSSNSIGGDVVFCELLDFYLRGVEILREKSPNLDPSTMNAIIQGSFMQSARLVSKPVTTDFADEEELDFVRIAFDSVVQKFKADREREGGALVKEVRGGYSSLVKILDSIVTKAPRLAAQNFEKLNVRIRQLLELGGDSISSTLKERLEVERSFLADRYDINEEVVRLREHLSFFSRFFVGDYSAKKAEFLLQEVLREFNTIGSKCGDSEVQHDVIEAKSELEKLRELMLNLE
jgi:uncharacterized protein (TIGR00255 family)